MSKKPKEVVRYFYISTMGKGFNNGTCFNTFEIITKNGMHPSLDQCVEQSNALFLGLKNVLLLSICKIPEADWSHFISSKNS
jgi:hypothetical protein